MSAFFIVVQGVNFESKDDRNSNKISSSSVSVNWSWREQDVGLSHKSSACSRSSPQGQADWPFMPVSLATLSFMVYDWKPPDNYSLLEDGNLLNSLFDILYTMKVNVKAGWNVRGVLFKNLGFAYGASQWCLSDCYSHRCSNYTIVLGRNGFGYGWSYLLKGV